MQLSLLYQRGLLFKAASGIIYSLGGFSELCQAYNAWPVANHTKYRGNRVMLHALFSAKDLEKVTFLTEEPLEGNNEMCS